jgi:hypothetical protein
MSKVWVLVEGIQMGGSGDHPSQLPSFGGGMQPPRPDHSLPGGQGGQAGQLPSLPPPPQMGQLPSGERPQPGSFALLYHPQTGFKYYSLDQLGIRPDQGLPSQPGHPSQGLPGQPGYPSGQPVPPPGTAQPKT